MNFRNAISLIACLVWLMTVTACNKPESPKKVSQAFWHAVQKKDMEAAKLLATWDTVEYLKYLNNDKFHPKRFELGDMLVGEKRAEVDTLLYTHEAGETGVKLPGVTIMVLTDNGWRVNVKSSMLSVVKYSANTMFDQINDLMQDGLKDLDKSLSGVFNELGQALEKSAEELKQELSKPFDQPDLNGPSTDKLLKKDKPSIDKSESQQI